MVVLGVNDVITNSLANLSLFINIRRAVQGMHKYSEISVQLY